LLRCAGTHINYIPENWSGGYSVGYKRCVAGEAFSRELRRCGPVNREDQVNYTCIPTYLVENSNPGCVQWYYGINQITCDQSIVSACIPGINTNAGSYCEGFGDPPQTRERVYDFTYHDFVSETDKVWTLTCIDTFPLN